MNRSVVFEMAAVRAVCRACSADVDALDHVITSISELLDSSWSWTLEDAAAHGYVRLVERILDATKESQNEASIKRALVHAASNGHLNTVKLLLKWYPASNVAPAMEEAAANGHMPILEWLHENTVSARVHRMTLDAMDSAAVNGHLDVLQWLHNNRREGCTTRAIDGAARAGRLEIVQWLHTHRQEGCTTQAMDGAAANGHLEMLSWLHANRHEGCTSLAMSVAMRNGHMHIVTWLERIQQQDEKPLVTWRDKHVVTWSPRSVIHGATL